MPASSRSERDVDVRLADGAEFEALVDEHFDIDPAAIAAAAAYYEALGLIPEGSAETYVVELQQRYHSVLGFYDPEVDVLVVRGGAQLDGGIRAVIVHELVHALDDQWFELSRPGYEADATTERSMTLRMVAEGDAVRITDGWIDGQPSDVQAEARDHVGDPNGAMTDFAEFIDFGFLAPYQAGWRFVTGLADDGGERLVDAVLLDPPETTEQVLYPDVFERREGRIRVPRPPADGEIIDEGVVGALFWTGLLGFEASGVPADLADAAVEGWGGDWEVSWVDGDLTCTRSDVVGDSSADTAELLDALTTWVANRPQVSVTEADGRVRMEVCYQVPLAGIVVR